ncbi:MAG: ORF6N domain-containing protein [Elusimicrobiota bacterium]|nr:ORF6N domain-containing protein [Elusimicrobiota bacterium]
MDIDKVVPLIHVVRGQRVMLDEDLARLYGVATKYLNQQVQRNRSDFPADFMFRLTAEESDRLRSQIVTLEGGEGPARSGEGAGGARGRDPRAVRGVPAAGGRVRAWRQGGITVILQETGAI